MTYVPKLSLDAGLLSLPLKMVPEVMNELLCPESFIKSPVSHYGQTHRGRDAQRAQRMMGICYRCRKGTVKMDNTAEEEVITWGFEHMSLQLILMGDHSAECDWFFNGE